MFGAHYSVLTRSDHLEHYGVKGMRWGKHLFGLNNVTGKSLNPTMETDTGTRTTTESLSEHMRNYFSRRDAKAASRLAESARKREASARAAAEAEKEAAKKKKKAGSRKKASSKAKSKDEDEAENEEKTKKEEPKTPDLPDDLVEKLQDLKYEMTPEEIKLRSENAVAKAKELIAKLPDEPTEKDIDKLVDYESKKRGTGYDRFVINIAIDTAMITYYNRLISELDSKPNAASDKTISAQIAKAQEEKARYEEWLKESLKTGNDMF